jgi:hypothetical protein
MSGMGCHLSGHCVTTEHYQPYSAEPVSDKRIAPFSVIENKLLVSSPVGQTLEDGEIPAQFWGPAAIDS